MSRLPVLLTILVCVVAIKIAVGQAAQSSGFHVTGIVPTKSHPPASPAQQSASTAANVPFNGITYNGGPVMNSPEGVNVYYVWYGDWSQGPLARTLVTDFTTNIGGTPYFNINTSYYDFDKDGERDPVRNRVTYARSITDNYSQGSALTDNQVALLSTTLYSLVSCLMTLMGSTL